MEKYEKRKSLPLIFVTPEVLMHVTEKESGIVIRGDDSGQMSAKIAKENPDIEKYSDINQDGIMIFWDTSIEPDNSKQIVLELQRGIFTTKLKAKIINRPKGAGFMGTRGCR